MDAHGVQMHVLTLSGGMPWQWLSTERRQSLAQVINDAGMQAHQKYPTRFMAGIEIDVRDPQGAVKEINRMAGKPGLRAIHLPNSFDNKDYLFEPEFEPVLKRADELGLSTVVSSPGRRRQYLWRERAARESAGGFGEHQQHLRVYVRARHHSGEIHHHRNARQVSEPGDCAAALRRIVPLHRGTNRAGTEVEEFCHSSGRSANTSADSTTIR